MNLQMYIVRASNYVVIINWCQLNISKENIFRKTNKIKKKKMQLIKLIFK